MDERYVELAEPVVAPEQLVVPKAKELVGLLQADRAAYASLLECRKGNGHDVVVLDVEVELGQIQAVEGIEKEERIAVVFDAADERAPEVLALRIDFPLVPHLNLRAQEAPKSLCLYDEPYDMIKLRWAASPFIERIRTWLARTARGELHEPDQGLEPILAESLSSIVLPADLFDLSAEANATELLVTMRGTDGRRTFVAQRPGSTSPDETSHPVVAAVITCEPVLHGVIHRTPTTLGMLHDFLDQSGTDLLGWLRKTVLAWHSRKEHLASWLAIILQVPKCRKPGDSPESYDVWAFVTTKDIVEVGESIGVLQRQDQEVCRLVRPDVSQRGSDVPVQLLNPVQAMSRKLAATLNGASDAVVANITAIGVGAIGSQVFLNLVRAGFGKWTLIDDDQLLPHNLARHALDGWSIGHLKADSLAHTANVMIDGDPVAATLPINVIRPGPKKDELDKALAAADIILDMSASVPAARHLACDVSSDAARMSIFTNPTGTNLVMLAEGRDRTVPLDMLEMQLYRAVASREDLADHLATPDGQIRYGRSCRDLSARIPQDLMAIHAGVASHTIKSIYEKETPSIIVWQVHGDPLNIESMAIEPSEVVEEKKGEWRLRTDRYLLDKLQNIRSKKLPKETGGVLLGSFDSQRRIAYVVDTLPSPPDSDEWPTLYIRGCKGLREQKEAIEQRTGGMLEYVGEWHSHPDGASIRPGKDDRKVFAWLTELMDGDGLPPLMMIAGSGNKCGMHLGSILGA